MMEIAGRNVLVVHKRRSIFPVKKPEAEAPKGITHLDIVNRVAAIKHQAREMRPPLSSRPESWHEEKSDLVHALERLEDDLRRGVTIR